MPYSFDWVDAFADVPFGGNGCVVVHEADALTIDQRTALVRETSLSECAYMVASDIADFGARYYLADREIPMAGHPTIATVASMVNRGMVSEGDQFTLEVGAGVLEIEVAARDGHAPLIAMKQLAPVFGPVSEPAEIAAIYGLGADEVIGTPQIVSTGTPFCVTVLRDHEALRRAVLDVEGLEAWRARQDVKGAAVMEPFLVTLQGAAEGDTFSRLLLAPPLPAEDPFTGAATGCMGAYLWHHGLIDGPAFTAEQGHWMGRPGRAEVEALGPPKAMTGVKVSGSGVVLMEGTLQL